MQPPTAHCRKPRTSSSICTAHPNVSLFAIEQYLDTQPGLCHPCVESSDQARIHVASPFTAEPTTGSLRHPALHSEPHFQETLLSAFDNAMARHKAGQEVRALHSSAKYAQVDAYIDKLNLVAHRAEFAFDGRLLSDILFHGPRSDLCFALYMHPAQCVVAAATCTRVGAHSSLTWTAFPNAYVGRP